MTSHALRHRASARTRTFTLALAGALAASMLVAAPALGNGAIERTGSVDLGVTDEVSRGGFALTDETHAYFGYHTGTVGRIEKVLIDSLERVDVPTAETFTVDPNFGWTSAAMHGDYLYLAAGNDNDPGSIRKVDKNTLQLSRELELPEITTSNTNFSYRFGGPLAAHVDADGEFGFFAANAVGTQVIGIFKVKLADMSVAAFGQLMVNPGQRIEFSAGGGEAGVFDATHGYLVTFGGLRPANGDDLVIVKFALSAITNTALTTAGDVADVGAPNVSTVDLRQAGHLLAGERVCALVADAEHLYAASCIFGTDPSGRVTKVKKSDLSLVSTTEVATPSRIVSAVVDGAHAYFISNRIIKVATATMTQVSAPGLCSGENVKASVLTPGGDLLLNARVTTGAIARVVRAGAGERAACPGGGDAPGGATSGGGDAAGDSAVDVPVAAAVAAAQAAGVAGTSAAVLVRGGAVVPITSGSASGIGPRGGVVLETEGLKVTVAAAGGASAQTGVIAPVGGEIVCVVCAELAAGGTIEAWMYSSPQLVAAVRVPDDHQDGDCVLLRIPVGAPLSGDPISAGAHTLQLRFDTGSGIEVLATGVTVGTAVPTRIPAGEGPTAPSGLLALGLLGMVGAAVVARRQVVAG